jgi:hypothetical protein
VAKVRHAIPTVHRCWRRFAGACLRLRAGTEAACSSVGKDGEVRLTPTPQRAVVLAVCLYVTAVTIMAAIEFRPGGASPDWLLATVAGFSVALGVFVAWRSPNSPAAGGLVLLDAAPTATSAIEAWGESFGGPGSIPGAHMVAYITPGAWVFNLTGFVVLASSFPSGQLPGRRTHHGSRRPDALHRRPPTVDARELLPVLPCRRDTRAQPCRQRPPPQSRCRVTHPRVGPQRTRRPARPSRARLSYIRCWD